MTYAVGYEVVPPLARVCPMNSDKNALRTRILSLRDGFGAVERAGKSAAVHRLLMELPQYQEAAVIMFYVSFRSEVETHQMIRDALAQGKEVVVPISGNNQIVPGRVSDFADLVPGAWGILEPEPLADVVGVNRIDLVLVPGAVFDREGFRVGYGVGYYDRFLRHMHMESGKIGLAFDLQVIDRVPHQPHDQPVDLVITESGVITCRRQD